MIACNVSTSRHTEVERSLIALGARQRAQSPVLVTIDDVDRILESAAVLVDQLGDLHDCLASRELPLLIVLTMKPGSDAAVGLVQNTTRLFGHGTASRDMQLRGLDALSIFELVRHRTGQQPSPALADELMGLAGGRPGLVNEAVDAALNQGHLRMSDDGLHLAVPLATLTPVALSTVSELTSADTLSVAATNALRAAALLGPRGPLALLRCAADPETIEESLDELTDRRVLDDDGTQFWFINERHASELVQRTPVRHRQTMSAHIVTRAATRLFPSEGDDRSVDVDLVRGAFLQLRQAGSRLDGEVRTRIAHLAATIAEQLKDWSLATQALEVLLESDRAHSLSRLELLVRCAEAHHWHLSNVRACELFDESYDLATELGDRSRAVHARLRSLYIRVFAGLPLPDWSPEPDDPPAVQAWFLQLHVDAQFAEGRADFDLERCPRAAEMARVAGIAEIEVRVAMTTGLQHLLRLELDDALHTFERGSRLASGCSDLVAHWPKSRIALTHWLTGNLTPARSGARTAAAHADAAQWWSEAALAHAVHAAASFAAGEIAESRRSATRATRLVARSSFQFALPIAIQAWLASAVFRGDARDAREALDTWADLEPVPELVNLLVATMLGQAARQADTVALPACRPHAVGSHRTGCRARRLARRR